MFVFLRRTVTGTVPTVRNVPVIYRIYGTFSFNKKLSYTDTSTLIEHTLTTSTPAHLYSSHKISDAFIAILFWITVIHAILCRL
jgi:hypothetical protein